MDPWDLVTDATCRHDGDVEISPGRTEHDPVDAYCARCGEKIDMGGMTWANFKLEAEFNQWAEEESRRTPARGS